MSGCNGPGLALLHSSPKKVFYRKLAVGMWRRVTGDPELHVVFVGDVGVGKKELLMQWGSARARPLYVRVVTNEIGLSGGEFVTVSIVRTLKSKRALVPDLNNSYYRMRYQRADVACVCFDTTDTMTWVNAKLWLQEVFIECHERIAVILVGCKADLHDRRAVSSFAASRFAMESGCTYIETGRGGWVLNDVIRLGVHDAMSKLSPALHSRCCEWCPQTFLKARVTLMCAWRFETSPLSLLPLEVLHIIFNATPARDGIWQRPCVEDYAPDEVLAKRRELNKAKEQEKELARKASRQQGNPSHSPPGTRRCSVM